MYYSRRKRKAPRKKNTPKKRRKTRRYRKLSVGFPLKHTCKLRYTDTIFLNAPTNGLDYHAFRANNVYDPDYNAGGHQVRYFDALAEVYSKYTVIGSKITAKLVGFSSLTDDAQALGIRISPDNTLQSPNTSIASLHEMGRSSGTRWTMVKSDAPLSTRAVTQSWSQKRNKAIGGTTSDDVLTGSTTGSGPGTQDYFVVFTNATGMGIGGDDPPSLRVLVSIDYIVVFHGLKGNLPQD